MFREVGGQGVAADGGQDLGGMGLEQPSEQPQWGLWVSLIPQKCSGWYLPSHVKLGSSQDSQLGRTARLWQMPG